MLITLPGTLKRAAECHFEFVVVVVAVVLTPDLPLLVVLQDGLNPADQTFGNVDDCEIFHASSISQVAPTLAVAAGQVGKVGAVWGPGRLDNCILLLHDPRL